MINNKNSEDISSQKKGNPFYMAPELFDENGVYSFQSDL